MRRSSEPRIFSWAIEDEIVRLKRSLGSELDPASRDLLERQLQEKQQQFARQVASEYQSAFTN